MSKDKRLILCPNCDAELRIELAEGMAECVECGKKFEVKKESKKHPEHFWQNPDTSDQF